MHWDIQFEKKSFQTLIGKKKLGKEKRKSLGSKWCDQCHGVVNILPRNGASVARTHVPPHPPTHSSRSDETETVRPGDLENINVLAQPTTSASRDDRNHFYTIDFLPLFFSKKQLIIKVFFFNVFWLFSSYEWEKKKKIERQAREIEKKISTMHSFHSVFLIVVCITIVEHFYSPPMSICRLVKKKKTRNSKRMRQEWWKTHLYTKHFLFISQIWAIGVKEFKLVYVFNTTQLIAAARRCFCGAKQILTCIKF